MPQSSQVCLRNNNQVLAKRKAQLSAFGFDTPACTEAVAVWSKKMSLAFPNKPAEFWGLVSNKAKKDGLSERRLEYIYEQLCDGRKVFDISDIFAIDKPLRKWPEHLNDIPQGEEFAVIVIDGEKYYMTIEEAERTGMPFRACKYCEDGVLRYKRN